MAWDDNGVATCVIIAMWQAHFAQDVLPNHNEVRDTDAMYIERELFD